MTSASRLRRGMDGCQLTSKTPSPPSVSGHTPRHLAARWMWKHHSISPLPSCPRLTPWWDNCCLPAGGTQGLQEIRQPRKTQWQPASAASPPLRLPGWVGRAEDAEQRSPTQRSICVCAGRPVPPALTRNDAQKTRLVPEVHSWQRAAEPPWSTCSSLRTIRGSWQDAALGG